MGEMGCNGHRVEHRIVSEIGVRINREDACDPHERQKDFLL